MHALHKLLGMLHIRDFSKFFCMIAEWSGVCGFAFDGIEWLSALPGRLGLPTRLSQVGISGSDLPSLAADAMEQTRLLVNNPREVTYDDALALYESVL